MSKRKWLVGLMSVMFAGLMFASQTANSAVTGGDSSNPIFAASSIKRFTGIVSGPGNAGDPIRGLPYIDFLCDVRSIGWKIEIIQSGPNRTRILGNPRVCDHVEVVMYYYSDPERDPAPPPPGYHGTAIVIRKIR